MSTLLIVTILQAILIIMCTISIPFRTFIDTAYESEYVILHRNGYAGGLACITAPGLFRFSMGLISALYYTVTKKKPLFLFLYIVLSFIGTMIARTGLFVGIVGLIIILVCQCKDKNVKPLIWSVFALICIVVLALISIRVFNLSDWLSITFRRLIKLSKRGLNEGFMNNYFHGDDNTYVAINSETFWGIGVTSGISGNGIAVNVDGGYLRIIAALGIIVAIVFYVTLFKKMFESVKMINNRNVSYVFFYFIIILIMGEFKEYTFYAQYMFCLFFVMMLFAAQDGLISKEQNNLQV